MKESIGSGKRLLLIFLSVLGFVWFATSELTLALVLLFCCGGILYLIFEDIAPSAHSQNSSVLAIGANCGFLLGLLGTMLIH